MVMNEFEAYADAIVMSFGDIPQAVLEILSGKHEPSALLPLQLPANMDTVEKQGEDTAFDMECHCDSEGHVYDFGYGMNWSGVISDDRTKKYAHFFERRKLKNEKNRKHCQSSSLWRP